MSLTETQCKHLRGLGHSLKPLVLVGSSGLSQRVVAEVNGTLDHHELIKVRVRSGDRKERDEEEQWANRGKHLGSQTVTPSAGSTVRLASRS